MKKLLIGLLLFTPFIVQGAQNDPQNPFSISHHTTQSPQQLYDEMLTTIENNEQLRLESLQQIKDLRKILDEQDQNIRAQIKSRMPLYPLLALVQEGKITARSYSENIVLAIEILEKAQKELSLFLSLLDKKNQDKSLKNQDKSLELENKIKFLTKAQKNVQTDLDFYTQLQENADKVMSNFNNSQSHIETTIKIREQGAYIKKTLRIIMHLFIITLIAIYTYKKYNGKIDFNFTNYLNSNTPFFNTFA